MADTHAPFAADIEPPDGDAELRSRPDAVIILETLLRLLFPEPPALDCVTVDDILRRYPLTGLGAPALRAIEQSQRIVRARGEYDQSGLCEFHIGLIYLNWDDPRAAAAQFALARQAWGLAGDASAVGLAHFAQGLALYHGYHNEAAMLQFSRAERVLNRPVIGPEGERHSLLSERMRPFLQVAQEELRRDMWSEDRPAVRQYLTVPPLRGVEREDNVIYGPPPRDRTASRAEASRAFRRAARPADPSARVPRPISNLPSEMDEVAGGPGGLVVDERYGWYQVVENKADFLPQAAAGAWVYGLPEAESPAAGREYVVAGSWQAQLGSIVLQPAGHTTATTYCYLGYRDTTTAGSQLFLDGDGRPTPAGAAVVLAVVAGIWHQLSGRPPVPIPGA